MKIFIYLNIKKLKLKFRNLKIKFKNTFIELIFIIFNPDL